MCGRFAMDESVDDLMTEFIVTTGFPPPDWTPSWTRGYNIAPTDTIAVVVESVGGPHSAGDDAVVRRLYPARWSLIPSWATERPRVPTFNARSETAARKPAFAASVASRRAIVPAVGYYEWRKEGRSRIPYFIHAPEGMLAFAALYSWWRPAPEEPWIMTTTILTRASVGEVAGIHDRAPVTLPADVRDTWLDPTVRGDADLVEAAVTAATPVAESLELHEVAPLTGDGPQLARPVPAAAPSCATMDG